MSRPDRDHYARFDAAELRRRLAAVQDRMTRADTMEAALADAFDEQEISAALAAKDEGADFTGMVRQRYSRLAGSYPHIFGGN